MSLELIPKKRKTEKRKKKKKTMWQQPVNLPCCDGKLRRHIAAVSVWRMQSR
jgi:hypothetical protein